MSKLKITNEEKTALEDLEKVAGKPIPEKESLGFYPYEFV